MVCDKYLDIEHLRFYFELYGACLAPSIVTPPKQGNVTDNGLLQLQLLPSTNENGTIRYKLIFCINIQLNILLI